jgi:hypothetical protein
LDEEARVGRAIYSRTLCSHQLVLDELLVDKRKDIARRRDTSPQVYCGLDELSDVYGL